MLDLLSLLITSIFAGVLNAIAGGGTFFVFPALLLTGVPAIAANATSTIAVWPASLASILGYRSELKKSNIQNLPNLPVLLLISVVGGWLGARLLLATSEEKFSFMVPWLLFIASLIFTYGKRGTQLIAVHYGKRRYYHGIRTAIGLILMMITALYGGFFGAGIGILTLAILYILNMENMHQMNAVKTVIAAGINSAAFFTFIFSDIVLWNVAFYMMIAAIIGGYLGAKISLQVNQHIIRNIVLFVAWSTTIYFFLKHYI